MVKVKERKERDQRKGNGLIRRDTRGEGKVVNKPRGGRAIPYYPHSQSAIHHLH
jgi:hypothetical protein